MGIGFALGKGFIGGALQQQEEVKDEAKERRKMAMTDWMTNVMPKVQEAQIQDDEDMSIAQSVVNRPDFAGNLPAAFEYAKYRRSGEVKNAEEYLANIRDNKITPNPQANAKFLENANKYMSYTVSENEGKTTYSDFKMKPRQAATPVDAQPTDQPRTLDQVLFGKQSAAGDMQKARGQFTQDFGVDPTAPVTSQFKNIDTSMYSPERINKEQHMRVAKLADINLANPEMFGDKYAEAQKMYLQGPEIFNAWAVKNQIPESTRKAIARQEKMSDLTMGAVLNNIDNLNEDGRKALASGQLNSKNAYKFLTEYSMTPEQRKKIEMNLKGDYPNTDLEWKMLFADHNKFADIEPDPLVRARKKQALDEYEQNKKKQSTVDALIRAGKPEQATAELNAPITKTEVQNLGLTKEEEAALNAYNGAQTDASVPDPQAARQAAKVDAPAGFSEPEDVKGPGFIARTRDVLATEPTADVEKRLRTPGMSLEDLNPLDYVSKLGSTMSVPKERYAEIAKNIKFSPEAINQFKTRQFDGDKFSKTFDTKILPHLNEYKSLAEGSKALPVGSAFKVRATSKDGRKFWQWYIVDEDKKAKYK